MPLTVLSNTNLKRANYHFLDADIAKLDFLPECDVIVNLAAESHVDNAITNAANFCSTNFIGVQRLLDLARMKQHPERPLFIQVSTDEVYGDIRTGSHSENVMLVPSNPYAATKAAADMLVKSWGRTYGIAWNIVRPSNNYGMHQYPEKLDSEEQLANAAWIAGDFAWRRHVLSFVAARGGYRRCDTHCHAKRYAQRNLQHWRRERVEEYRCLAIDCRNPRYSGRQGMDFDYRTGPARTCATPSTIRNSECSAGLPREPFMMS